MAVETRASLSATFFIVGPKGALLSRGPSLSGRKNDRALRSKDFGRLQLEAEPAAKELEKEQLVETQRSSGTCVLVEVLPWEDVKRLRVVPLERATQPDRV